MVHAPFGSRCLSSPLSVGSRLLAARADKDRTDSNGAPPMFMAAAHLLQVASG